jgi:chaperonin GroES
MDSYELTPELIEPMAEEMPMEEMNIPEPVEPENNNIAASLDDKELREISSKVIRDFEQDLESRAEWEEKHAQWLKIYYQEDVPEMGPWSGSSEESIPVMAEAVNQFQSRSYKAFFPTRYFVDAIPVGNPSRGARERAERVGKHMSYQLSVLDRSYKKNKAEMFTAVALDGSDFTKSYYSPTKKRTIIERVRALDLVVPYGTGPRRLEEIERKTQIKFMSLNETKILKRDGWFIEDAQPWNGESGGEIQTTIEDAEGITKQTNYVNDESECCILEQHCLLDLDEDGISEPYIVWVDRQSRKTLRIQIRYEVDENGIPVDNKEPIEYFTHYQFLPNPNGFYGLGFGFLLGKMNKALNKLVRLFIDGNELHVVGNTTSLVSESLGLPGDTYELSMGKANKIPRSVDDIRKHFLPMSFEAPSPQTLQAIELLTAHANKLSTNSDILSGNPDKVYQPTAMLAMIEQGLQLFSSVQEFLGYSMEDELQKVYRINSKYLEDDQYFVWGDEQISVTREDYTDDFRVVPIFDPKYSTRSAKLSKAQAVYEFTIDNPLMAQDEESLYSASLMVLEALDVEDIDVMLKKPSEKPQVARIDDQNLENTYFLMPPEKRPLFDVFPDQDHIQHIKKIDKFIMWLDQSQPLLVPNLPGGDPSVSNLLSGMSNEQKQELVANLLRHRTQHMAFMFGQMNGVLDEQGQPMDAGRPSGMAKTPDDTQGVESLISLLRQQGMDELGDGQDTIPTRSGEAYGETGNSIR